MAAPHDLCLNRSFLCTHVLWWTAQELDPASSSAVRVWHRWRREPGAARLDRQVLLCHPEQTQARSWDWRQSQRGERITGKAVKIKMLTGRSSQERHSLCFSYETWEFRLSFIKTVLLKSLKQHQIMKCLRIRGWGRLWLQAEVRVRVW